MTELGIPGLKALAVLAVAVFLFATSLIPLDVTALLLLVTLPLLGLVPVEDALGSLGAPVVVLIAGLFVVGEALVRSGLAFRIGDWLVRAGNNPKRITLLLLGSVGGLGAFMSSTGIVALFVPVVRSVSRKLSIPSSRLMMCLSIAALISGMMTLIATPPNMIVSAELERSGHEPLSFFSVTPVGVLTLVLVGLYLTLLGDRLFAGRGAPPEDDAQIDGAHLTRQHGVNFGFQVFQVMAGHELAGQSIGQLDLRRNYGVELVALERGKPINAGCSSLSQSLPSAQVTA